MTKTKASKKKASPTIEEIQRLKKLTDEFRNQVLFWIYDNPQQMIEHQEDYIAMCDNIETTWGEISSKYKDDEDVTTFTLDIVDLIVQYREMVEGIKEWFKYSLALGHYNQYKL